MASMQKGKQRQYWTILVIMLMFMACTHGTFDGQRSSYLEAIFRDETGASDTALTQMVVSGESGTDYVYVGGASTLSQLDVDLTPVVQSNVINTNILEIAPSPIGKLVHCGGMEGKCQFRELSNVSEAMEYTAHVVVENGMAVAVIAKRNQFDDTYPESEIIMYVATSPCSNSGINNPCVEEPITQRELYNSNDNNRFGYSNAIGGAESEVEYIQAISWSDSVETYNYFVVHSVPEQSRLGRICSDNNQGDLGAYTEILLSCPSYDTLQSIHIDSSDVLYGVFTDGTQSAVCSYPMTLIQDKFVDTICECGSTVCNGNSDGISYLDSYCLSSVISKEFIENNYQCSFDSTFKQIVRYAQAGDALIGTQLIVGLSGQQSSITSIAKENETVALVTTSSSSNAILNKIHVMADNSGRLYETVNLEVKSDVLNDVYINETTENLFILTNKEVMKLAVVNCRQYTTCTECLRPTTQDGDPFCGWCTLEAKCSRSSECNNVNDTLRWLPYNQDCIAINNLNPPFQERSTSPQNVMFSVSQLPPVDDTNEYQCRFDNFQSTTAVSGSDFTCETPAVANRPSLDPGEDSVTMTLAVFASATSIVEIEYPFYDCAQLSSCSECVTRVWACNWCVFDGICTVNNGSDCTDGEIVIGHNNEPSCPGLNDLSEEIFIPVGLSREIVLTGVNLPTDIGRTNYSCILSSGSEVMMTSVSQFTSTSVICAPTEYDYESSQLEEVFDVSVEYNPGVALDNPGINVTLYKCSANGMSCRSCVTMNVREELGCGWCTGTETQTCQLNVTDQTCSGDFFSRGQSASCPDPVITSVFPSAGPLEGNTTVTIEGTNLAAELDEIQNITIAGIECDHSTGGFIPGLSIDCLTGTSGDSSPNGVVIAEFTFGTATGGSFSYRNPTVSDVSPRLGIASGGTELEITGENLNTGRDIRVHIGDAECLVTDKDSPDLLKCTTTRSSALGESPVAVSFDTTVRMVPRNFSYVLDPAVDNYTPKQSIRSGGILLTVEGSLFDAVQTAKLELTVGGDVIEQTCSVDTDTVISCMMPDLNNYTSDTSAPSRKRRQATDAGLSFLLDGFTATQPQGISIRPDPDYDILDSVLVITSPGNSVTFRGRNLNTPEDETENFVTVCIGQGECTVLTGRVTQTELECLTPREQPDGGICTGELEGLPQDVLNVVVFHGSIRQYLGTAQYSTDNNNLPIIIGAVVGGVVLLSIVIFLIFVTIGHRNYRAQIKNTEMEMVNLMQHTRREVMEGFFIDQEMSDIKEQLQGLGMPFVSNHDYMKSMLFFGLDVKPVTTEPENPSDMEERAMLEFSKLLSNRDFLIIFIHTLDSCKRITTKEKANIASLLTVVLVMEKKFRYFTEVMMVLMSDAIGEAADRQRLKQLFKRTETLEDKMLNNWIALAMFKYVKESVGHPLYMLYQAIKIQCEKGPVDAITGKSSFSLNFDNLLTESQDFEELTLNVESEIGIEPVKVLNVDTITQVKEKILDAMYRKKHTKYQRSAREVDLVLKSGNAGALVISDYDTSTQPSMGWCPINTLQHYGIISGTQVSLANKQEMPNAKAIPVNDEAKDLFNDVARKSVRAANYRDHNSHDIENGPQDIKYYHLVQTEDSEEQNVDVDEGMCAQMQRVLCFKGTQGKRKIREIFLQRLVSVKQSINEFVNEALEAMFTIREDEYVNNLNNIPFALRFLFNYFDEEASRYDDDGTAATWKNNILPLRFWSTILAHPSFIFNMRQSRTADSSVIVLNQMLDNACKGVVPTLKLNSSPSRLLFNKELPDYINLITSYYHNIQQTPVLQEEELREECKRIDDEFSGLFSRLTTLKQLFERIRPHEDILVEALSEDERCNAAHFGSSLERVGNMLDEPED